MRTHHEQPTPLRLELLGHLAAAARLALEEAVHADGVRFNVSATDHEFAVDCTFLVDGVEVSGWGQ